MFSRFNRTTSAPTKAQSNQYLVSEFGWQNCYRETVFVTPHKLPLCKHHLRTGIDCILFYYLANLWKDTD